MSDADTSKAAVEWPREIWMAERDDHDQGIVSAVLSEHATVARWAGGSERDKDFHHYIDMDVYDSAEKYHAARYDALAAEREALVEAERLCRADFHQMRIANDKLRAQLAEARAQVQTARESETPLSEDARIMQKRIGSTPFPDDLQGIADDAHVLIARQAFRIADLEKQERKSRGYRVGHIAGFHAGIRAAANLFDTNPRLEDNEGASVKRRILALIQPTEPRPDAAKEE